MSFIWPIDRTLSGVTFSGQSGPRSNGIKGVLCIPQSSRITGASLSDCLVSYPGHSLEEPLHLSRDAVCILQSQPTELLSKGELKGISSCDSGSSMNDQYSFLASILEKYLASESLCASHSTVGVLWWHHDCSV